MRRLSHHWFPRVTPSRKPKISSSLLRQLMMPLPRSRRSVSSWTRPPKQSVLVGHRHGRFWSVISRNPKIFGPEFPMKSATSSTPMPLLETLCLPMALLQVISSLFLRASSILSRSKTSWYRLETKLAKAQVKQYKSMALLRSHYRKVGFLLTH